MSNQLLVRRAAVLGAGVMGAQIAAHLTNAGVDTVLFDLAAKDGDPNGIVNKAIANLAKLSPAPLASKALAERLTAANYDTGLEQLRGCDLVIEAIAERMDWKQDLYKKIADYVPAHAVLASNTSGLGINKLAEVLPEQLRHRFLGVHFFNPPRYMHLAELIPAKTTDAAVLEGLETFLTTTLGKGVVIAKDTPNFIGNRIGVFSMLAAMHHTEQFGLGFDAVDALTGPAIGRPKSATYRTADVVGLDTMAHVIKTMADTLPDDPWHQYFKAPKWLSALVEKGALGQKAGAGFYTKKGKDILVLDLKAQDYRASAGELDDDVAAMLKEKDPAKKFAALRASSHPQAQFLWAAFRDTFHYSAYHLESIADTARDVDFAMRWGFGSRQGPFELWQEAGWKQVATWIQEDIDAGKALSKAPLPEWVFKGPVAEAGGVHTAEGSWSPAAKKFIPRRKLPVYERQFFPEDVLGSKAPAFETAGTTLHEDDAIRLWTLDGANADVLIASIKTKMHAISPDVAEGLAMGVDLAEKSYKGMVIWSNDEMFSAGADLQAMLPAFMMGGAKAIEGAEAELQNVMLKLRYAAVPVVSAIRGIALGGGCEMAVYSAKRVAAMESYVGLVEVGVGLVPGAGGLAYIARRAAENASTSTNKDILPFLTEGFTAAAMAKVGTSAIESRKIGYLLDSDVIVPNKDELLFVALNEARALFNSGYRAPHKRQFPVVGRNGLATIKGQLVNMRDGGFISAHDFHIAGLIAGVVCGGDVDAGTLVTEEYLMTLERKAFCSLLEHPKTQERIMGMMSTGKPVRN